MPGNSSQRVSKPSKYNNRVMIVQILVAVFLCINLMLLATFLMKEFFYTTMRYILFAITLLSDSMFLLLSDILLIFTYFQIPMQMWLCLLMHIILSMHMFVTPITLTMMTLERYVAICKPLRHAELCTTRASLHCILVIYGLSSVPCCIVLSIFFASAQFSFYSQGKVCTVEVFIIHSWQSHLRSAINEFYFLIMCIVIVFSYIEVMKVAKSAAGENKKSSWKGLRTVILHAVQLLLCLIQLWCPFIEAALLKINFLLYINVRYFNYIAFILTPRCLSPLIYGLRDNSFSHALKYYALCGLYKKPLDFC